MKNPIQESMNANERKCTICSYIHVTNLAVSTRPTMAAEKAGRNPSRMKCPIDTENQSNRKRFLGFFRR